MTTLPNDTKSTKPPDEPAGKIKPEISQTVPGTNSQAHVNINYGDATKPVGVKEWFLGCGLAALIVVALFFGTFVVGALLRKWID